MNKLDNTKSSTAWTDEGRFKLLELIPILLSDQKEYGKDFDLEIFIKKTELLMSEDFTVDQTCEALKEFVKTNRDMPVTADLIAILKAKQKPRILF